MDWAIFGAGCFWGVESRFRQLKGVKEVASGYAGGTTENPTYQQVCSGKTGHAEVVRVEFDPEQISYRDLLEAFWGMHDPTTWHRQGPDIGAQYRSVIFYRTDEQKQIAEESLKKAESSGRWKQSIVTEILPAPEFYRAEEYHQRYLEKHGYKH